MTPNSKSNKSLPPKKIPALIMKNLDPMQRTNKLPT